MMDKKDKLISLLNSLEIIKKYVPKDEKLYNELTGDQDPESLNTPVSNELFSELVHDTSSSFTDIAQNDKKLKKNKNAR